MGTRARLSAVLVVGSGVIAACGSSGGNGAGGDGGGLADGSLTGASSGAGLGSGDGAGGTSSGAASGGGTSGGGGADGGGCPPYQSLCGGSCIPTSIDPNNCGGCGVQCTGTTACSAGTCASHCQTGLTACSHSCVDTSSDNANCGGCGHACPSGQGCVAGGCVNAVNARSGAVRSVTGGGPAINIPHRARMSDDLRGRPRSGHVHVGALLLHQRQRERPAPHRRIRQHEGSLPATPGTLGGSA